MTIYFKVCYILIDEDCQKYTWIYYMKVNFEYYYKQQKVQTLYKIGPDKFNIQIINRLKMNRILTF